MRNVSAAILGLAVAAGAAAPALSQEKPTPQLQLGGTYADVLSELASGALRIGIHVQGFASTGSESLINTPEPGTALLLALGLGGLAAGRRRVLGA